MKFPLVAFLILISSTTFSQIEHGDAVVMDTVMFEGEKIVRYTDYSWEYVEDIENLQPVEESVAQQSFAQLDTAKLFTYRWNTHRTYSRDINLKNMTDTVDLELISTYDPNVFLPQVGSVTSPFGPRWNKMHKGVDIRLKTGDKVHSCFGGKVRYAQYNKGGYGNLVIIRHYNGLETYYAHLSELYVSPGQVVSAGHNIGLGGSTGHSTGPHLHFEVRFLDNAIDPQLIFNFKDAKLKSSSLRISSKLFGHKKASTKTVTVKQEPGVKKLRVKNGARKPLTGSFER